MTHQLIVCTTDAKRLAVVDVPTKPSDRWVDHCAVVFGKWLLDHPGHRVMDARPANGNFVVWVAPLH